MFEKWKSILTVGLLSAFVLGFGIWAAVKPADALSTSERRPLAQMPELSASSYLSGKFMSGYEDYATDQFPLREQFRTLKALMGLYVFGQKDNNGVYLADGSAAKLEYPLNEGSVTHAADRFRYLYETLMAGTDTKVYLSAIPDKNYFLAEANGYPALDYQALTDALRKQTEFAAYIDLFGTLTADDYYRTDSHWRQENLLTTADTLAAAMGGELPLYRATRAVHSCFLLRAGRILYQCEDLGRHNALDKAVGCALADGVPLGECVLYTSGRVPVDMVRKAIRAGVPALVSKTMPTVQSVELAEEYGLRLFIQKKNEFHARIP